MAAILSVSQCVTLNVWFVCDNWVHSESYFSMINHKRILHKPDELITVFGEYRQISNISDTTSQILNVSRRVLQLSLSNLLTPGVKSRMKMLQLHLSDQQFYCLLRRDLLKIWRYFVLYGNCKRSTDHTTLGFWWLNMNWRWCWYQTTIFTSTIFTDFSNTIDPFHRCGRP